MSRFRNGYMVSNVGGIRRVEHEAVVVNESPVLLRFAGGTPLFDWTATPEMPAGAAPVSHQGDGWMVLTIPGVYRLTNTPTWVHYQEIEPSMIEALTAGSGGGSGGGGSSFDPGDATQVASLMNTMAASPSGIKATDVFGVNVGTFLPK